MSHSHPRTHRRIERLFCRGLSATATRALYAELADCAGCAALFDRYHLLETRLQGDDAILTTAALERVERAVLDAVVPTPTRRPWLWLLPLPAAAAVALLLLLTPVRPVDDHMALPAAATLAPVELRARSAGVGPNSEIGVRLLRVQPSGAVMGAPELHTSDLVTFTYTNTSKELRHLTLFGLQTDGKLRRYYPGYRDQHSVAIQRNVVDEPLGDGVRLQLHHSAGPLRVIAIFTRQPLAIESIKTVVDQLEATALHEVSPLPLQLPGALQHSLLLELTTPDEEERP